MKNYKVAVKVGHTNEKGLEMYSDIWDDDVIQDTIEAETEEEAILLAIDYLKDSAINFDIPVECDEEKHEVKVYDETNDVSEIYYDFKAKLV